MHLLKRRWSGDAEENLVVKVGAVLPLHGQVHLEVLAHAAHHRLERARKLPVNSVVEHVENNDSLISHLDVLVAQ